MQSLAIFRACLFAVHFSVSVFLLVFLFLCKTKTFNEDMYGIEAFDYKTYKGSYWDDYRCNSTMECYREGEPWFDGHVLQGNMYWNAYTVMYTMQWITTSFALFYMLQLVYPSYSRWGAMIWGACGYVIYFVFFVYYAQTNWFEFIILTVTCAMSLLLFFFFEDYMCTWIKQFPKPMVPIHNGGRVWEIPKKYLAVPQDDTRLLHEENPEADMMTEQLKIRVQVILRYLEYAITAPLLYIAMVLVILVGPPYWSVMLGYLCMLGCCLCGVPLHFMHLLEVVLGYLKKCEVVIMPTPSAPDAPENFLVNHSANKKVVIHAKIKQTGMDANQGKIQYIDKYNDTVQFETHRTGTNFFYSWLLIGKWRANWTVKLHYLQMSWFGLVMALAILVYLGRGVLLTTLLPMYISAALWIMIILYSSFGIAASVFYYFVDKMYWQYMDLVLDVLSFTAKIPVILILGAGYMNMPGNTCMS